MKTFNRIYAAIIIILVLAFFWVNLSPILPSSDMAGRPYQVEINRAAKEIEKKGLENIDRSKYDYITNIIRYRNNEDSSTFYEHTDSDYSIRQISGELYRFDYICLSKSEQGNNAITMKINCILCTISLLTLSVMTYIRQNILKPFEVLCNIPYELSKGNLTIPIKEQKSRFFGRFIWGIDMLREHMEQQKQRELSLERSKKTLVLSISHDIKTPLSAIKLYANALSRGLYPDKDKQTEIAGHINAKADEISEFVAQLINTSNGDFLDLEVKQSEFYLSELIKNISAYYGEKLALIKTEFTIGKYSDCILKGDIDRSIEVIQNILENAIKYGNGHTIKLLFSTEEDCLLITVQNSGCSLPLSELPHIFESFWRGSNTRDNPGSGLGLYICRQLMHKMGGEIYAETQEEFMCVTAVFQKTR